MPDTVNIMTVTLELVGLPLECPHCGAPAPDGQWGIGVHGNLLHVICPRCITAIAPVRAVAAPKAAEEDKPAAISEDVPMVCTKCRKPVQRSFWARWAHVSIDDGLDCSAVNWGPVKAMVAAGNENVPR